jgi:NAD(P)-dependent dehydrogenase (short-subunit alcohol dehydrogenase family)
MDMKGKTVLITGSIDGVGRYVAKRLAADGANARARLRKLSRELTGLQSRSENAPTAR